MTGKRGPAKASKRLAATTGSAASGRDFRFDDATVAELSRILTEEVFLDVQEGLERAANYARSPKFSRAERMRQERAKRRLHALIPAALAAVKQLDLMTRERLATTLSSFGLGVEELRRLGVYVMVLTRPERPATGPANIRFSSSRLTAIGVASELERAGVRLGTAQNSKFGKVLSLVLRAGDRNRWGSDVRHLQKLAVDTRKVLGGSLQITPAELLRN